MKEYSHFFVFRWPDIEKLLQCFSNTVKSADLRSKLEIPCMTTDLNDSDKQASVYGDIRSLCVNWSVWSRKAVWFASLWLFSSAQNQTERERELFTRGYTN